MIDQYDKTPSGLAMKKIDRASNVLRVYPHHVHHDFNFDKQGNIYAIDQKIRNEAIDGLKPETPYLDDGLLIRSPDGEPLDRISPIDVIAHRAAMNWSQRLKRVFRIDIETCQACGGAVRIIASIEDPVVIGKILAHR